MSKYIPNRRTHMAIRTSVVDDIDGSEGAETIPFSYDGKAYEIDLSKKNQDRLEQALKPYIEKARESSAGKQPRRRNGAAPQMSPDERRAILAWAKSNGKKVGEKGRIAQTVIDEYKQSTAKPKPPTPSTAKP